jgi:uncharacterized protein DUF3224
MTDRAVGTFEVKLTQQSADTPAEGSALARLSIDKQYHGDVEGTGTGEMLSVGTAIKNSAAYVAVERVSATVRGRAGSFALIHVGIMNRGAPQLSITIVPDSGTGELAGISGSYGIEIENGRHSYWLEYQFSDAS